MIGYGTSGTTHDFFAYNAAGDVWNGTAFATWADGSYATYRITATQAGTSGRFTGTAPTGTVRYELRERGATLALSYVAWVGPDPTETLITNAATAATQATAAASQTLLDADGNTLEDSMKLLLAVNVGKVTATSTSAIFRAADDSKARVTATVDASGNRTTVTTDAT